MKHATIVYPAKRSGYSTLACITAAFETFITANAYRRKNGEADLFSVELAGTTAAEEIYGGMFTVRPQRNISDINKTDLVIVPSMETDFRQASAEDDTLIEWITKQYKQGAVIVSICSGAFMLAASGILDGRSCSTHWAHADAFREQFPKVNLMTDRLITDENGICTNGGAFSFLNLMIYLVEKYYDRETAIFCSKSLQIEMDRNSQSAFSIFTGQKRHGDKMVEDAQKYIESSLTEKISVEELSSKFAIGRRNFDRRFIKATGNTPLEYSQRVKVELAKKELEVSRKTVNEVMYEVGYSDQKAFRELFRKITGMSPLEYRSRYNKEAAN
ncbi:MAG: helix-turn-helix domain-containing protein [Bacteroidota bacterium]